MKKYEYNPLDQFVEKERTRTLLIEAAEGGTAMDFWRRVLIVMLLAICGGVYYWSRTPMGRDFVEKMTGDPPSMVAARKKAAALKQMRDSQPASAGRADGVGVDGGKFDSDYPDDLVKAQKTQEALGARLEAFSQGQGPMPAPTEVKAAMEGQGAVAQPPSGPAPASVQPVAVPPTSAQPAPAPVVAYAQSPGSPPSPAAPAPTAPAITAQPAAGLFTVGSSSYRQMGQIPPAYAQDRTEFPDAR